MFSAGHQIGPYTLKSKIGNGGFGVVWLAERRTAIASTQAALKIPLDTDVDLEAVKREAELWVQASGHPNVLPIIEADIYDGHVVIASEYAPDGSLELWLKQYGGQSPTVEAAVDITSGILAGLEHLHEKHIIHRDLKPANILLQRGIPRLADFGISRVLRSTTHSSIAAGTPAYMAPEAFDGERSEQTDLWAVGVILYMLLSGRLPFAQTDMASLMAGIITREPEPLPPAISKQLRMIVARSLRKSPSDRFKSATEMRLALRGAGQSSDSGDTVTDSTMLTDAVENENPLAEIRRQMLVSASIWQLQESLYKVDEFLSRHPHHTEARMTKDQITKAIRREQVMLMPTGQYATLAPAPASMQDQRSKSKLIPIIILIGVGLLIFILSFLVRWFF